MRWWKRWLIWRVIRLHPVGALAYRARVAYRWFRFVRRNRVFRTFREVRKLRKQLRQIERELRMGKSILESKTVWGVVGMIGALVAAKLGYNIDADTLGGLLLDISTWAVGVVMFFWGLRGRFVAIIHPPAGHVVDTKSLLESRSAWGIVLLFLDFVSVKLGFGHVDVEGVDALLSDIVTYGVAAVAGLTGIIGRVKATAKIASVLPK